MWDLKLFRDLRAVAGVRMVHVDQCVYGCQHRKPTAILTNAPWIKEKWCKDAPPHEHVELSGKVWSYKTNSMVWYTSEAEEYPAAMCEEWAKESKQFLENHNS